MVCTDRRTPRWRGWTVCWLIALALIAGLIAVAGSSSAHASTEHGELTFHDEEQGPATTTLTCQLWTHGHGMEAPNGTIVARQEPSPGEAHNHTLANWTGEADDTGTFAFERGPLDLHDHGNETTWIRAELAGNHSSEPYRLDHTGCEDGNGTASDQEPLPGERSGPCDGPRDVQAYHDGLAIAVHWEGEPGAESYLVNRSVAGERTFTTIAQIDDETSHRDTTVEKGTRYTYVVTILDEDGDAGQACEHVQITARDTRPPACPEDVQAQALEEGEIELAWSGVSSADAYKVYRATENGTFGKVSSVMDPGYVDEDPEADTTYRYRVVGASEDGESTDCPAVEATAIPAFPSALALGLAALGGLLSVHAIQRRRSG